jgi:hypothetical protein
MGKVSVITALDFIYQLPYDHDHDGPQARNNACQYLKYEETNDLDNHFN